MEDVLQRYFEMDNSGIGIYFDADEIIELLDYFEETDEFDHFKKVVNLGRKLHPHNPDIKIQTCKVHIYNKKYEKALALIEQIGDPENQELRLLKYECLCALDRYEELLTLLEVQLFHPDEELQHAFEYVAALLNEQYKGKHAYDLIRRGLALFPDSYLLKEELCFYFETQGELEQALETVKELVDFDSSNPDYWYIQGRLYALMETYDKAIESFDFALICDDTDLEIKILKAYCHFMLEQYKKVIDVYMDVISEETDPIDEYIRPFMETYNYADRAYILLRKMLEEFDEYQSAILSDLPFCAHENEEKETGFSIIADCFPNSLLFFILKEILMAVGGEQHAIINVEQLLNVLYQTGTSNRNFQIDVQNASCVSLLQKVEKIMNERIPDNNWNKNDFYAVRQLIKHLLDGDINLFCKQFAQCSLEVISENMEKLFLPDEILQHQTDDSPLNPNVCEFDYISLSKLAETYLNDKNHYN